MYREGDQEPASAAPTEAEEETPQADDESPGDSLDVAFLVFRTKAGAVYVEGANMARFGVVTERDVSPNEMYRMCLDLADQLSAVRVVGEVLKGVRAMLDAERKNVTSKLSDVPE
jgi:hypothetical protein